jgi:hypothetical protein
MRSCAWAVALIFPVAATTAGQAATVVRGHVLTDSAEQPIADATISLGNGGLRAVSDSLGRYRIRAVPPGRYTIAVRRLGFAPYSGTLIVPTADSVNADFLLAPVRQDLPSVNVTSTIIERKLAAFEERRRFGIGHFLTEADLQKAPGTRLSEKLRHLPGLLVVYPRTGASNQVRIVSTRGPQGLRPGRCTAALMLDGIVVDDFSINSLDPGAVAGIEWYAGPAQMPAQFNMTRNACGLLVIWTK